MNFFELMEFHRAFSVTHFKKAESKPSLQVLHDFKNGYSICLKEETCGTQSLYCVERMAATRGLALEKKEKYWVVCSP